MEEAVPPLDLKRQKEETALSLWELKELELLRKKNPLNAGEGHINITKIQGQRGTGAAAEMQEMHWLLFLFFVL